MTPPRIPQPPKNEDAINNEARDWLVLLVSGRATVRDAKAFQSWCRSSPQHAQAFAQLRHLWDQLGIAATSLGTR